MVGSFHVAFTFLPRFLAADADDEPQKILLETVWRDIPDPPVFHQEIAFSLGPLSEGEPGSEHDRPPVDRVALVIEIVERRQAVSDTQRHPGEPLRFRGALVLEAETDFGHVRVPARGGQRVLHIAPSDVQNLDIRRPERRSPDVFSSRQHLQVDEWRFLLPQFGHQESDPITQ